MVKSTLSYNISLLKEYLDKEKYKNDYDYKLIDYTEIFYFYINKVLFIIEFRKGKIIELGQSEYTKENHKDYVKIYSLLKEFKIFDFLSEEQKEIGNLVLTSPIYSNIAKDKLNKLHEIREDLKARHGKYIITKERESLDSEYKKALKKLQIQEIRRQEDKRRIITIYFRSPFIDKADKWEFPLYRLTYKEKENELEYILEKQEEEKQKEEVLEEKEKKDNKFNTYTDIEVIQDLETNKEIILEKGYYKISWEDNFVLLKFNTEVSCKQLDEFIINKYSERNYKIKKIDYIIDDKKIKE